MKSFKANKHNLFSFLGVCHLYVNKIKQPENDYLFISVNRLYLAS
jgi:hypothetical protein